MRLLSIESRFSFGLQEKRSFRESLVKRYNPIIRAMRNMPKPVICGLNGVAAGAGCSIALACDYLLASKNGSLIEVFINIGLVLDSGSSFFLPRLVGYARALEIAAFDQPISAARALDWGLVTKVVEDGQALEEAYAMAKRITVGSLNSFAWSKKLINDSFNTSFETQIENERTALEVCADHSDGLEGLAAFTEKRKPNYFAQ